MKDLDDLAAACNLAMEGTGQGPAPVDAECEGPSTLGHSSAYPDPWAAAQRREVALRMAIDIAALNVKRSGKKAPYIGTDDILAGATYFLKFIEG